MREEVNKNTQCKIRDTTLCLSLSLLWSCLTGMDGTVKTIQIDNWLRATVLTCG